MSPHNHHYHTMSWNPNPKYKFIAILIVSIPYFLDFIFLWIFFVAICSILDQLKDETFGIGLKEIICVGWYCWKIFSNLYNNLLFSGHIRRFVVFIYFCTCYTKNSSYKIFFCFLWFIVRKLKILVCSISLDRGIIRLLV